MTRLPTFVFTLVGVFFLAFTACKKAAPPPPEGTIQLFGVSVEVPKLDTEFQNVDPDVQAAVTKVKDAYRFGQYGRMIAELEALANIPNLTGPQKKLASDLMEQMKQVLAKLPQPGQ
jgi:hypothetical protein